MKLRRPAVTSQGTRFMFRLCVHVYMDCNDLGKKFTTRRERTQISNYVCRLMKSSAGGETLCSVLFHQPENTDVNKSDMATELSVRHISSLLFPLDALSPLHRDRLYLTF